MMISGEKTNVTCELQPQRVSSLSQTLSRQVGSMFGLKPSAWFSRSSSTTANTGSNKGGRDGDTVSDLYVWMQQQQKQHYKQSYYTRSRSVMSSIVIDDTSLDNMSAGLHDASLVRSLLLRLNATSPTDPL